MTSEEVAAEGAAEVEYVFAEDPVVVDLAVKLAAVERQALHLVGQLVQRELQVKLPEYAEAEAAAEQGYSAALARCQPLGDEIGALKMEIRKAEGEAGTWREQLGSDRIGDRVAARSWFAEWSAELGELEARRDKLEQEIEPLRQAATEARNNLIRAHADHETAKFNASDPMIALHAEGQQTDSFKTFFLAGGHGVRVLLSGNTMHSAFWASFGFMDEIALRSGWRSDHLPKEAEKWRDHWQAIQDAANLGHDQGAQDGFSAPDHPLTGSEETMRLHLEGERISDYKRNYPGPGPREGDNRGPATRNERVTANQRPEMQWDR